MTRADSISRVVRYCRATYFESESSSEGYTVAQDPVTSAQAIERRREKGGGYSGRRLLIKSLRDIAGVQSMQPTVVPASVSHKFTIFFYLLDGRPLNENSFLSIPLVTLLASWIRKSQLMC